MMTTQRQRLLPTWLLITAWLVVGGLFVAEGSAVQGEELFRDRVAPLLSEHCLNCHNRSTQKGGLALDTQESLTRGGDSGEVVAAGDVDSSYLIELITPIDGKAAMPKGGKPLSAEQIDSLRQWIQQGAEWPAGMTLQPQVWWSLRPLTRPALPPIEGASSPQAGHAPIAARSWIRTPIDAFVYQRLQRAGLAPSPEADRRTLMRRLYFDLLGLPPSPEAILQFTHDPSPLAYDRLVDRLLASPQYGERWARHWLDVVKYADTCGYDKDKLRPNAYPYRDYVIRSLNADKPYWQFVQEQIAGDVLFPGQPDGILGLGFIAAGPWDFIGHVEVPETKIDGRVARHIDRDEMVTNTINTFSSVTIQCARCHDHKFDPFTQQHYYNLQAVFAAVDRADRLYDVNPQVQQRRQQLSESQRQAREALAALESAILRDGGPELARIDQEIRQLEPQAGLKAKDPAFGYHSSIVSKQETLKWVQIDLGQNQSLERLVLRPCHDEFAGIGAGFGFPIRFQVLVGTEPDFDAMAGIVADETKTDLANPGLVPHEVSLDGRPVRYIRIAATKLAERQNDYILALAEVEALDEAGRNWAHNATVTALDSIEAPVRWAKSNLTDGIWAQAGNPEAAAQLATTRLRRDAIWNRLNTAQRQQQRQQLEQRIAALGKEMAALPPGKMVYAAATDFAVQGNFRPTRGKPRPIHVLRRGSILDPAEESRPGPLPIVEGFPETFPTSDGSEGARRAALASWLTRHDHPLTWRSIVNRIWQYHFGQGIVESPNDFGRMGQLPSHPDLLDWLAVEFRDQGQSIKDLHRLIVTSSVYRQSSDHDPDKARIDGSNRLLWRMNRKRLEAEAIRDAMLSVSDRMNPAMYGPGFYLFVLERTEHSPHYEYHKHDPNDAATHRRSVYRFVVRSQPNPFMTTLDCADSSQSTPKRNETLTSLQALSLLNNKFTLAMCQQLAARLQREQTTIAGQVERAIWLTTGRAPTESEQQQLQAFAEQYGLPNMCRVLFNLSEFTYLD